MAAKKTNTMPNEQPSEQGAPGDAIFPYAVESPYLAGWEHALTKKHGARGKTWTSTKGTPQWTVRFQNAEAAAWFKDTWATEAREPSSV